MTKHSSNIFLRLFHTRWFYIVNVLLIFLVGGSFIREMVRNHDIAAQIQSLQRQSQTLQSQHLAIGDLKNAVQTETYVESEARLKLGLKKPGESLVIVKDAGNSNAHVAPDHTTAPSLEGVGGMDSQKSLANSSKWWYYFFNKQVYREVESRK